MQLSAFVALRHVSVPAHGAGVSPPVRAGVYMYIYIHTRTHTHHQFVQACGAMAATKETPARKTPRRGRAASSQHPWPFMPPPDAAATSSPAAQPARQPPPPTNYAMGYAQGYASHPPVFPGPYTPAPLQKKARKRAKLAAPDAAFAATAAAWAHHYSAWGVYPPPSPMGATPGRSGAVAHRHVMPPSPFFPLSSAAASSWPSVSIAPPTLAEICRARELENTLSISSPTLAEICRARELENTFYLKSKELPKPTASDNEDTTANHQDSSWNGTGGAPPPAAPPPPNEAEQILKCALVP
jgi:hypothetical protein